MATPQSIPVRAPRAYQPWERWFFVGVLSSLFYGLPNEWIRTYYGVQGTKSALLFYTPVLLFGLLLGLQRAPAFIRAMSVDPFIPLLILWALASAVWSTDFGTTVRQTIAWGLATTFAYYAVTRFDLREILRLTALTMLFGTALNVIFIFALPRYGTVLDPFDPTKSGWKGITSNKNSLGQFTSVAAILLWMARRTFTRYRAIYTIGAIVNVAVLVRADAKTSFVALLGTGALMIVFRAFRAQRQLFGVAVIGMLISSVLVLLFILGNREQLASGVGRSGDLTGRTALWADLVPAVAERPVQGYGWGGFWNGYFSPAGDIWIKHSWQPPDAHNLVLQLALNVGLVGVLLYSISFLRGMARGIVYLRDSADPIAMLPVVFFAYELLGSITEHGNLARGGTWVLHVIFLVAVGLNAKKAPPVPSRSRSRGPQGLHHPTPDARAFASGAPPNTTP
ncbi:MAG TPA: O-antigen ligase family protein [Acidimicrobiales bacterium]|nr:O-antigen ligase family protein [Acidimicrobiales bacterium]